MRRQRLLLANRIHAPLSAAEREIERLLVDPGRALQLAEATGNRSLRAVALIAQQERKVKRRKCSELA